MESLREEMARKYFQNNYIQTVMFEVTHRCPSDCVHCFLVKNVGNELSRDEIFGLFDQLRDKGLLEMGITGGEPFLRDDLPEILEYARKQKFSIILLTTGIFVGKSEAEMLRSLKIKQVEISLLGARAETHDMIMKYPGAFESMISAVKYLREQSIPVKLKTTVLRQNWTELQEMSKLAESLGALFSANVTVTPQGDGNKSPQQFALTEKELENIDFKLLVGGIIPGEDEVQGAILTCLAGISVAGISPQGDIFPCIILRKTVGNIRKRSFEDIWQTNPDPILKELRTIKDGEVAECMNCSLKTFCNRCPGFAYLETGNIKSISPISCIVSKERKKQFSGG